MLLPGELFKYLWEGEWVKENWEWARGEQVRKREKEKGYLRWVLISKSFLDRPSGNGISRRGNSMCKGSKAWSDMSQEYEVRQSVWSVWWDAGVAGWGGKVPSADQTSPSRKQWTEMTPEGRGEGGKDLTCIHIALRHSPACPTLSSLLQLSAIVPLRKIPAPVLPWVLPTARSI